MKLALVLIMLVVSVLDLVQVINTPVLLDIAIFATVLTILVSRLTSRRTDQN